MIDQLPKVGLVYVFYAFPDRCLVSKIYIGGLITTGNNATTGIVIGIEKSDGHGVWAFKS